MATTWSPRATDNRNWLLADGTVVSTPELEQTPSGRKVRIVGTDISGYARDIEDVIQEGVTHVARERGTHLWAMLNPDELAHYTRAGAQKVHLVTDSQSSGATTTFWWKFRSPDLPVEAVVVVEARTGYAYRDLCEQSITASLLFHANTSSGREQPRASWHIIAQTESLWEIDFRDNAEREAYRDAPIELLTKLGSHKTQSESFAIQVLLEACRYFDSLAEIQIPDGRTHGATFLTLHSDSTNFTAEARDSMVSYLDDAPTMQAAVEHYNKMIKILRNAGLALPSLRQNHFLSALNGGEGLVLTLPVKEVDDDGDVLDDTTHELRVNLATGTFTVVCGNALDLDDAPQAWQEAVTIASLTGQEDELLEFAKAKARRKQEGHAEKIMAIASRVG